MLSIIGNVGMDNAKKFCDIRPSNSCKNYDIEHGLIDVHVGINYSLKIHDFITLPLL